MATHSSNNEENLEESQQNSEEKEEQGDPNTEKPDALHPQDVLCDSCMDGPSKALKSCLTCLVSYCEAHLRPHLENAKFQNHRLVDPLHDIDCRTCEVHQLPLERFCLTDDCCVCLDCEKQEHDGHTTASVGEARTQIEVVTHNTYFLCLICFNCFTCSVYHHFIYLGYVSICCSCVCDVCAVGGAAEETRRGQSECISS